MKNFWLLLLIAMVVSIGCGDEDIETGDILGEKVSQNTNLIAAGELRKVAGEAVPGAPAKTDPLKKTDIWKQWDPYDVEITYWKNWSPESGFSDQLDERVVEAGTTVYTKVVFPIPIPITFSDSGHRPVPPLASRFNIGRMVDYRMLRYDAELGDGDAKPLSRGNKAKKFVCRFDLQTGDAERSFWTKEWNGVSYGLSIYPKVCDVGQDSTAPVSEFVYTPQEDDRKFSGWILGIPQRRDHSETKRANAQPVAGATVTIVSGDRTGEKVMTNTNGQYQFPDFRGHKVHIRVEASCYETKEAIVYRSRATRLPTGPIPTFRGNDPQRNPGVVVLGAQWPDTVREILERVTVMPDVLLAFCEVPWGTAGFYSDGIVLMRVNSYTTSLTIAHELMHSHQDYVSLTTGREWRRSPEARAFIRARSKDLQEHGKAGIDKFPPLSSLHENAAESFAEWWDEPNSTWTEKFRKKAPNRSKWVEEWIWK